MAGMGEVTTMDRILQEITAVSRRLEEMDLAITSVTSETKSMRLYIAGIQSRVTLNGAVEGHMHTVLDKDKELGFLRSKLTDLEDRSQSDNICLFGFLEQAEGTDIPSFLRTVLTQLTETVFDPPLELQRAHRLGPRRKVGSSKPRPIIACLLRHEQVRQLLMVAFARGLFKTNGYEIRIPGEFSRESHERRKGLLALRPKLRQLEVKYGLFDPARLWTTKNGVSKNVYDPEDLRLYLDNLQSLSMDTTDYDHPLSASCDNRDTSLPSLEQEGTDRSTPTFVPAAGSPMCASAASERSQELESELETSQRGQELNTVASPPEVEQSRSAYDTPSEGLILLRSSKHTEE
ncbi:hypothetical protein NDU88_006916 [Pleurodeles waltl]|uniref:Uncharacterized protein n=1 Tax=Pleurodeles waltl TaxID=8319 RepID=A0AAV7LQJ5_PLEWA|nr:hypothetical protein NDU88_006916 [Pleurodeles waltl]